MTRTILFLVDHKHRDLPSLTLIGHHLETLGFEAHYVALGNELEIIARVNPGYIVLPKPIYDYERLIRWKMDGRKLIVIETEGNPQDIQFEMRIRVRPDLYLFWNEAMVARYRRQLDGKGTALRVVGFPRSDFLHSRLDGVFPSRAQLLTRYGLDAGRRTLTIATSSQDAHFSEERLRDKRRRRSRSMARTAEYLEIVANMRELRDTTVDFVRQILERFPDVNIALKPHPHENVVFWASLIESLKSTRVALVVGEPINHLLRVSDFHLSYNVCTTTVEALLAGLAVAEINTHRSEGLYSERHLSLPTFRVRDWNQLEQVLDAALAGVPARVHQTLAHQEKLRAYVKDFFYAFDGRRCEAYAQAIAEWADTAGSGCPGVRYLISNPKVAAFYAALRGRTVARAVLPSRRFRRRHDVVTKVGAPTLDGERSVKRIKDVLVDEEFGLYDYRMKLGDEKVWLEKFRRSEEFS